MLNQVESIIFFDGKRRRRRKWAGGWIYGSIVQGFWILLERQNATVESQRPFVFARSSPSTIAVRGSVGVLEYAIPST